MSAARAVDLSSYMPLCAPLILVFVVFIAFDAASYNRKEAEEVCWNNFSVPDTFIPMGFRSSSSAHHPRVECCFPHPKGKSFCWDEDAGLTYEKCCGPEPQCEDLQRLGEVLFDESIGLYSDAAALCRTRGYTVRPVICWRCLPFIFSCMCLSSFPVQLRMC